MHQLRVIASGPNTQKYKQTHIAVSLVNQYRYNHLQKITVTIALHFNNRGAKFRGFKLYRMATSCSSTQIYGHTIFRLNDFCSTQSSEHCIVKKNEDTIFTSPHVATRVTTCHLNMPRQERTVCSLWYCFIAS